MMKAISPFRIAAWAKNNFAIIIIAILFAASTASADESASASTALDGCKDKNGKYDSWCLIKKVAGEAKEIAGYVSAAKAVLELLDLIPTGTDAVMEELKKGFADVRWADAMGKIGDAQTIGEEAIASVRRHNGHATSQDDRDSDSAVRALMVAGHEAEVFYLPTDDNSQAIGTSWLGYKKDDLDPHSNSTYDWRLGMPALLQMIKYRLVVLAAFHPSFRVDGYGWTDLDDYRAALQKHYKMMLKGVRCSIYHFAPYGYPDAVAHWPPLGLTNDPYVYDEIDSCADIYTGLSTRAFRDFRQPLFVSGPPTDPCHSDYRYSLFWGDSDYRNSPVWGSADEKICAASPETADEVIADLKREVISSMPLYEVKGMIDTLYMLTHPVVEVTVQGGVSSGRPAFDLTEKNQQIPSFNTPSLCLQANGGQAQLSPCDGGSLQHWIYDRPSGIITNPDLGKCLEISYEAPASNQSFPVDVSDCYEDKWQQWTFDPETGVLLSGMGTVLTIFHDFGDTLDPISDFVINLFKQLSSEGNLFQPGDLIGSGPLVLVLEQQDITKIPAIHYVRPQSVAIAAQQWLAEQPSAKATMGISLLEN